jgi:hypothetical protein
MQFYIRFAAIPVFGFSPADRRLLAMAFLVSSALGSVLRGGERTERFDQDPGWEGRNNRSSRLAARAIRQDFGFYPDTRHGGGRAVGEIGGVITPAAEPAYYAKPIELKSFRDRLTASGTLACGAGPVHVLLGFFNAATVSEWRTPNTIALRIQGRGDRFFAYVEYATARWRAGGDEPQPFARVLEPRTGKAEPRGFAARGAAHSWSLSYDPEAALGRGAIVAMIDGESSVCELAPGHKADGATFNRVGILGVAKSADSAGELWIDDLDYGGVVETFSRDPGWDGLANHRIYDTTNIRPRFDFGFSPTRFAGGTATGELGGLIFRGDIRYVEKMACYGDRVGPLSLDEPLRASGTIALRRAVSDSTTLLGFYHAKSSLAVNPSQSSALPEHFLGLAVEGPSREGFFVYPAYRLTGGRQKADDGPDRPRIQPDGMPHSWEFAYSPAAAGGRGRLTLTLDGQATHIDLTDKQNTSGGMFNRFGVITTWIDGNGQSVYFDDLTYTATP